MESGPTVELLVPGLLGPVPDPAAAGALLPALPVLDQGLARAGVVHGPQREAEAAILAAFGLECDAWPVAPVARAGEHDSAAPGATWWLRIDPVYLRIDMTHARLFSAYMLALEQAEADLLVESLNRHFAADGWRVEAPAPERWYMASATDPGLVAHSPTRVAGRNIDHFMPGGSAGAYWRGVLNEVQMLLHDHPVNAERERAGRLPVNSIWPWGGGRAPEQWPAPPARVFADDATAQGAARLADVPIAPLPDDAYGLEPGPGRNLVVDPAIRDPLVHGEAEAWVAAVDGIAGRWLDPLHERLRRGEIARLVINGGVRRRFALTRAALLWRAWRRPRPWTRWLETEA